MGKIPGTYFQSLIFLKILTMKFLKIRVYWVKDENQVIIKIIIQIINQNKNFFFKMDIIFVIKCSYSISPNIII
jgi:hypothetical protein